MRRGKESTLLNTTSIITKNTFTLKNMDLKKLNGTINAIK